MFLEMQIFAFPKRLRISREMTSKICCSCALRLMQLSFNRAQAKGLGKASCMPYGQACLISGFALAAVCVFTCMRQIGASL